MQRLTSRSMKLEARLMNPLMGILFIFVIVYFFKKQFIEVYFTYRKSHLFQVYKSVISSNFSKWHSRDHTSAWRQFLSPVRSLTSSHS